MHGQFWCGIFSWSRSVDFTNSKRTTFIAAIVESRVGFAQQSRAEHLHADDTHQRSKNQQWITRHIKVVSQLHPNRRKQHRGTNCQESKRETTEEFHRAAVVVQHVFDG